MVASYSDGRAQPSDGHEGMTIGIAQFRTTRVYGSTSCSFSRSGAELAITRSTAEETRHEPALQRTRYPDKVSYNRRRRRL